MSAVAWTFALLGATVHMLAFAWEVLLFLRPGVHQGIFFVHPTEVRTVRLWAFNVGFYNLFLAGIVLLISDRLAMSRPRGKGLGGAVAQGRPPLVALIAMAR